MRFVTPLAVVDNAILRRSGDKEGRQSSAGCRVLLLLADARGDQAMLFALGFRPGRVVSVGGPASSACGRGDPLAPTS